MWKVSHMFVSKCQKPTCILYFIIHWSWIWFVEVVIVMVQVMKERSFGIYLVVVCFSYVWLQLHGWWSKMSWWWRWKAGCQEAKHQFCFYHCCCVLFLVQGCKCLLCFVLVLMMGWMPTFWCSLMLCSHVLQFLLHMWEGGQEPGYCRVHRGIQ